MKRFLESFKVVYLMLALLGVFFAALVLGSVLKNEVLTYCAPVALIAYGALLYASPLFRCPQCGTVQSPFTVLMARKKTQRCRSCDAEIDLRDVK